MEGQLGRSARSGPRHLSISLRPLRRWPGFLPSAEAFQRLRFKDVLSVTKAYSSCVGAGPFVTELFGEEAEELRKRGGDAGEYGATTGRPSRV